MKILILGSGRMGSWFANVLSKNHEVSVYDRNREKLLKLSGIKKLENLEEISDFNPELLINAVNLGNTIEAFNETIPFISEDCIISDIASIKGELESYYYSSKFKFVSTHPMFGPTNVNMEFVRGESAIIIEESDEEGKKFFKDLYLSLGLNIKEIKFDEHDIMMAYSLTLPFTASLVFAGCVDNKAVPGTNFKKHLEIAKGLLSEDETLLTEVLFNKWSIPQIEKINTMLEYLKHIVGSRDSEELKILFNRIKENIGIKNDGH